MNIIANTGLILIVVGKLFQIYEDMTQEKRSLTAILWIENADLYWSNLLHQIKVHKRFNCRVMFAIAHKEENWLSMAPNTTEMKAEYVVS